MDSSFTEHVLERARERQRKLQESSSSGQVAPLREANLILDKASSSLSQPNLCVFKKPFKKEVVSDSNLTALKENQAEEDVRVEVEIQDSDSSESSGEGGVQLTETPGLREQAKNRLRKLGKLYAGGEDADISSPIQRTEAKFLSEILTPPDDTPIKSKSNLKSRKGLSKLADLAQNISKWEDDISHAKKDGRKDEGKNVTKKSWKPPAPQPPPVNSPLKNTKVKAQAPKPPEPQLKLSSTSRGEAIAISEQPKEENAPRFASTHQAGGEITPKLTSSCHGKVAPEQLETPEEEGTPKQLNWDKSVLDSLESQGFTRTTSSSRLIYNYISSEKTSDVPSAEKRALPNVVEEDTSSVELQKNVVDIASTPKKNELARQSDQEVAQEQEKFEPKRRELPVDGSHEKPKAPPITAKKFIPLNVNLEQEKVTPRSPGKPSARSAAIVNKMAIFESSPSNKDPAVMTLAEKKALFEKNKGTEVVMPLRFNANPKPVKANCPVPNIKPTVPKETPIGSPVKTALAESGGIASKIAALIKNKNTISQEQIRNDVREQRQKEMEVLLNRFNRNKVVVNSGEAEVNETTAMIETPPTQAQSVREKRKSGEKRSKKSDSPQVTAALEDVKRIKVSQPKDGQLYPCLSDIDTATETEPERTVTPSLDDNSREESFCSEGSGGADTSFGREILQAVCKNQTPQKRSIIYDEASGSDMSDILDDMDDYLDEAMAEEGSDYSNGPTPPKIGRVTPPLSNLTRPSDSFHYKNYSPKVNAKSPSTPSRASTDLPTHVIDGDDVLPLTHTVSFYRRQQSQVKTPVRQISRHVIIEEAGSEDEDKPQSSESEVVDKKIQDLLDEINRQQMIISQTSQALNLCNATPEFTGSTEQVEAEKVLLLATNRRQACLNEIQRLRVEKTLRPQGQHSQNLPLEKGALTLTNITLPLKKEYVRALAAAGGKGHHVVCLIKCGEQVVTTHLVSTVATSSKNPDQDLRIPGTVRLENIFSDFTITFEVYCLQAQEEVLPHEVKYHINKKPGGSKLTPKKAKQESRMIRPPMESPAGPNAVRTSTFALMGYVVFSIQAINKKHWTLNKAPSMSPLEGSVEMKVSCELAVSVEYKGFLTMFEDVSGFGAWHRRWCLLNGDTLSYWKYPDDEKKKAPIDSIDLRSAITEKVGPVSRDICARLHTFLIERERKAEPRDKESLVVIRKGDKTIIRHLLSADTKEERIEWCSMFNKALTALRMWGGNN